MTGKTKRISIEDTSVPVVILYVYHYGQLGAIRSLGRLGIAVRCVDPDPTAPGLFSRYSKGKFLWDVDGAKPQETVRYLLDMGKKIGKKSLLIHTTDISSTLLADYADELSEWYIFPRNTPELVQGLASKKGLYFLAKKWGISTPETCFPQSIEELDNYLKGAVFPIMLKEIFRAPHTPKRMFIAKNKSDLFDFYRKYEDTKNPNFMLQEYIPGGDDSIWFLNGYFDSNSECLFSIVGKKIRQSPIHTGVASMGICLKNDAVDQLTKRFMKSIGYKGILDIGYRYDARDGQYKVLDVNPRIGASFRLLVGDNGLDSPRAEYLDLTGQKVPASQIVEGRKWFIEDRDLVSTFRYYREKSLTFRQWIKSFRGVQESAWFARDDPIPFFLMCARSSRKVLFTKDRSVSNPYCLFPLTLMGMVLN
jgi:predicted ATP-grasp superfamily ATP-dependent carboligase